MGGKGWRCKRRLCPAASPAPNDSFPVRGRFYLMHVCHTDSELWTFSLIWSHWVFQRLKTPDNGTLSPLLVLRCEIYPTDALLHLVSLLTATSVHYQKWSFMYFCLMLLLQSLCLVCGFQVLWRLSLPPRFQLVSLCSCQGPPGGAETCHHVTEPVRSQWADFGTSVKTCFLKRRALTQSLEQTCNSGDVNVLMSGNCCII